MTFGCQCFPHKEAFYRRQEIPLMQAFCERFYPRKETFLFDFGTMADLEMTASVWNCFQGNFPEWYAPNRNLARTNKCFKHFAILLTCLKTLPWLKCTDFNREEQGLITCYVDQVCVFYSSILNRSKIHGNWKVSFHVSFIPRETKK